MHYDDHNPPHVHAGYQGRKALPDFQGALLAGDMRSMSALNLAREWIRLRRDDLIEDWDLALAGKPLKKLSRLNEAPYVEYEQGSQNRIPWGIRVLHPV
jgi:hypothetical protein